MLGRANDGRHLVLVIQLHYLQLALNMLFALHVPETTYHIEAGANEVLLAQLHGVAARDALQLVDRVLPGVNRDTALHGEMGGKLGSTRGREKCREQ